MLFECKKCVGFRAVGPCVCIDFHYSYFKLKKNYWTVLFSVCVCFINILILPLINNNICFYKYLCASWAGYIVMRNKLFRLGFKVSTTRSRAQRARTTFLI